MSSVRHTQRFRIHQPAAALFPLFSAEGEKLWVPGWDYENIIGTTTLHEDYVFITRNHDHASTDAVWLAKRYDPESFRVQFYKVEPEDKVGIITVRCIPLGERDTEVEVAYEYIALGERGSTFIEGFTAASYKEFIGEWKRLLEAYFR